MAGFEWHIEHHVLTTGDRLCPKRQVTVAIPSVNDAATTIVVYCADGQVVETLAAKLKRSPNANPPILIGVHSHPAMRAEEYLPSSHERHIAHENFFTDDVRSWAHETFGTSVEREKSVVFGFSNGGAFAIATAFRRFDRFAAAVAFSVPPCGNFPEIPRSVRLRPSIYMAVGNEGPEKSIRKNMLKLLRVLRRNEIAFEFCERTSGHTLDFWATEFVVAVNWLNQNCARHLSFREGESSEPRP